VIATVAPESSLTELPVARTDNVDSIDNLVITEHNDSITLRSDHLVGTAHPSDTRVAVTAAVGSTPSTDSALIEHSDPGGAHRQRRTTPAQNHCAGCRPGRRVHPSTPIGACESAKEDS
jgi:hypothetical protein